MMQASLIVLCIMAGSSQPQAAGQKNAARPIISSLSGGRLPLPLYGRPPTWGKRNAAPLWWAQARLGFAQIVHLQASGLVSGLDKLRVSRAVSELFRQLNMAPLALGQKRYANVIDPSIFVKEIEALDRSGRAKQYLENLQVALDRALAPVYAEAAATGVAVPFLKGHPVDFNLWTHAIAFTGGDAREALKLIAVLFQDVAVPGGHYRMRFAKDTWAPDPYSPEGKGKTPVLDLLQQLQEWDSKQLYPPQMAFSSRGEAQRQGDAPTCPTKSLYHFYVPAWLATTLVEKGHDPRAARVAAGTFNTSYEAVWISKNVKRRPALQVALRSLQHLGADLKELSGDVPALIAERDRTGAAIARGEEGDWRGACRKVSNAVMNSRTARYLLNPITPTSNALRNLESE